MSGPERMQLKEMFNSLYMHESLLQSIRKSPFPKAMAALLKGACNCSWGNLAEQQSS